MKPILQIDLDLAKRIFDFISNADHNKYELNYSWMDEYRFDSWRLDDFDYLGDDFYKTKNLLVCPLEYDRRKIIFVYEETITELLNYESPKCIKCEATLVNEIFCIQCKFDQTDKSNQDESNLDPNSDDEIND